MRIEDLIVYFDSMDKTAIEVPFRLSKCEKIINIEVFLKAHIEHLTNNSGKRIYKGYYDRLYKFYELTHGKAKKE